MTHEKSRELDEVLQRSTVQREFVFALLPITQDLSCPASQHAALPCQTHRSVCLGGVSVHHHTPKDPQIFLSHLFRTMLMPRRRRAKIMATKESARME